MDGYYAKDCMLAEEVSEDEQLWRKVREWGDNSYWGHRSFL